MVISFSDLEKSFAFAKDELLDGVVSVENPKAFLLGGQGASGKSVLTKKILKSYALSCLSINGDDYRLYHPDYKHLIKFDIENFSTLTQPFSAYFTEHLIDEAITNRYNVIIEGTMRNSETTMKTATKLKQAGFEVHAAIIAAHPKLTEMGVYLRFFEEYSMTGFGRLAEINSHNAATEGVLKTADILHDMKNIDFIHIYSYAPWNEIHTYQKIDNEWNDTVLPSQYIETERKRQIADKQLLASRIGRGKTLAKEIIPSLKPEIKRLITELSKYTRQ